MATVDSTEPATAKEVDFDDVNQSLLEMRALAAMLTTACDSDIEQLLCDDNMLAVYCLTLETKAKEAHTLFRRMRGVSSEEVAHD